MSFTVVIPARMQSSRLPGKPLAELAGRPMIAWVAERAQQSGASRVIVATDHQEIADVVKAYGVDVCLTSEHHTSGTERIAEVIDTLKLLDDEIIVNVQGDEPLIPPENIQQVADNLRQNAAVSVATLCVPITIEEELLNPNVVKVVKSVNHHALYFSRSPIPYLRKQPHVDSLGFRHVGIYGYRAGFVKQYVSWSPATLEVTESLEQLRVLANDHTIHVEPAKVEPPAGIDTPEDLARVRDLLAV